MAEVLSAYAADSLDDDRESTAESLDSHTKR
jgi:hypothetical protein